MCPDISTAVKFTNELTAKGRFYRYLHFQLRHSGLALSVSLIPDSGGILHAAEIDRKTPVPENSKRVP